MHKSKMSKKVGQYAVNLRELASGGGFLVEIVHDHVPPHTRTVGVRLANFRNFRDARTAFHMLTPEVLLTK